MTATDTLNCLHGRPDSIIFEASPLGGPVARLIHGDGQALVALHGAHVLNWTHRGEGLLWLSPVARIREGKGIRGGIPVCWPWFGDHAGGAPHPAHGFVRHRAWDVVGTTADASGVSIRLGTATRDSDLAAFPHPASVELTVRLDTGLSLSLETRNLGEAPLALTQALHTYFRVSDIASVSVLGLDGATYLDKLQGFARMAQAGPIAFGEEVDRIYVGETSRIELVDAGLGRRLLIESRGSRSAVVWNPWTDKTARLGDMGSPDAFRQLVCIETANAGDDVVSIPVGGAHVLSAAYRLLD